MRRTSSICWIPHLLKSNGLIVLVCFIILVYRYMPQCQWLKWSVISINHTTPKCNLKRPCCSTCLLLDWDHVTPSAHVCDRPVLIQPSWTSSFVVTASFHMDLEKVAAFQAAIPSLTDYFHAEKRGIHFSTRGPIPPGAVDRNDTRHHFLSIAQ